MKFPGNTTQPPAAQPWPAAPAPEAAITNRAIAAALRTMAPRHINGAAPPTARFLSAGWSGLACFEVQANEEKRFVKVARSQTAQSDAALGEEYRAARWAFSAGLSPAPLQLSASDSALVFAFLPGGTLTAKDALKRQDEMVDLLRRWHTTPIGDWAPASFDPVATARAQWQHTATLGCVTVTDATRIARAIDSASDALLAAPAFTPVACHTDFHVQNIVLDAQGRMFAVDCEEAGLCDPMWDLASLAVNLATMDVGRPLAPQGLADIYGATAAQRLRLQHHVVLSLALYASWTAAHGSVWRSQYAAAMQQLVKVMEGAWPTA